MLSLDMTRYVELHRACGFKFHTQHQMLTNFVTFAEKHGDEFVRIDRALDWAARAASPAQRCKRLLEVRRFALAMRPEDLRGLRMRRPSGISFRHDRPTNVIAVLTQRFAWSTADCRKILTLG